MAAEASVSVRSSNVSTSSRGISGVLGLTSIFANQKAGTTKTPIRPKAWPSAMTAFASEAVEWRFSRRCLRGTTASTEGALAARALERSRLLCFVRRSGARGPASLQTIGPLCGSKQADDVAFGHMAEKASFAGSCIESGLSRMRSSSTRQWPVGRYNSRWRYRAIAWWDREDVAGSLGPPATSVSILGHRRIQLRQQQSDYVTYILILAPSKRLCAF